MQGPRLKIEVKGTERECGSWGWGSVPSEHLFYRLRGLGVL